MRQLYRRYTVRIKGGSGETGGEGEKTKAVEAGGGGVRKHIKTTESYHCSKPP